MARRMLAGHHDGKAADAGTAMMLLLPSTLPRLAIAWLDCRACRFRFFTAMIM